MNVETLLASAVRDGDLEMVEFFMDHYVSIYGETSDEETHVHGICANKEDLLKMFRAPCYGKTEICKLLVEYGVDIDPSDILEEEMKNEILLWRENFGKK